MRILISGASGFIGKPLTEYFSAQGHTVIKLVRGPERAGSISWDPEEGRAAKEPFEGFDAVIHLAGEPLFSFGRWTRKKKEKILFSRTVGTRFLSHILAQLLHPPRFFLSASAVGLYGDAGERILTEESEAGRGFLANVCCEWEKASRAIEERGTRVVRARFGTVLGPDGGALKKMVPFYKLGLGGRLGSGKQWVSWVAREDLIRAIGYIMDNPSLEGAVNIAAPYSVRQEEFSKTLAELLHRPALGSLPGWFLRCLFGQMADEVLLASAKVQPKKLLDAGFSFRYSHLADALRKAFE